MWGPKNLLCKQTNASATLQRSKKNVKFRAEFCNPSTLQNLPKGPWLMTPPRRPPWRSWHLRLASDAQAASTVHAPDISPKARRQAMSYGTYCDCCPPALHPVKGNAWNPYSILIMSLPSGDSCRSPEGRAIEAASAFESEGVRLGS